MGEETVTIEGLAELQARLSPANIQAAAGRVLGAFLPKAATKVAIRPNEGPWNVDGGPGTSWYQRGFGPRYHRITDDAISGQNTSEDLQQSWQYAQTGWNEGVITSQVSYAAFVVGSPEQQASWAPAHGWRPAEDVVNEMMPELLDELGTAIVEAIAG